jgi:prepilin-type processing-associated H-X9-DG protein
MKFQLYRKGQGALDLTVLVVIVLTAFTILFPCGFCSGKYESARRAACANNLKQLALVLSLYANENGGRFPPIDNSRNNFMFEGDLLYPEYLTDVSILACPSDPETDPKKNFRLISVHRDGTAAGQVHPDCITNMSYSYIGWMVMTDKEAEAFFNAYDEMSPADYDKDITVPEGSGNAEGSVLHRLSAGVERFLIPNPDILIQSDEPIVVGEVNFPSIVPIMWDQISTDITEFNHVPAGQNVLYLDGHVEFHRYDLNSTQFPTSPLTGALFDARPRERIPHCEEFDNDHES